MHTRARPCSASEVLRIRSSHLRCSIAIDTTSTCTRQHASGGFLVALASPAACASLVYTNISLLHQHLSSTPTSLLYTNISLLHQHLSYTPTSLFYTTTRRYEITHAPASTTCTPPGGCRPAIPPFLFPFPSASASYPGTHRQGFSLETHMLSRPPYPHVYANSPLLRHERALIAAPRAATDNTIPAPSAPPPTLLQSPPPQCVSHFVSPALAPRVPHGDAHAEGPDVASVRYLSTSKASNTQQECSLPHASLQCPHRAPPPPPHPRSTQTCCSQQRHALPYKHAHAPALVHAQLSHAALAHRARVLFPPPPSASVAPTRAMAGLLHAQLPRLAPPPCACGVVLLPRHRGCTPPLPSARRVRASAT